MLRLGHVPACRAPSCLRRSSLLPGLLAQAPCRDPHSPPSQRTLCARLPLPPLPQAAKASELRSKLAEAKQATSSEKQLRQALEQHLANIEGQLAAAEAARKVAEAQLATARRQEEASAKRAAAAQAAAQADLPGLAPKPMLPAALQAFAAKLVGSEPTAPQPQQPQHDSGPADAALRSGSGATAGTTAAVRGAVSKPLSRRARKGGKVRALSDDEQ